MIFNAYTYGAVAPSNGHETMPPCGRYI